MVANNRKRLTFSAMNGYTIANFMKWIYFGTSPSMVQFEAHSLCASRTAISFHKEATEMK